MRTHERGNATIGVILGSAFAGLLYLQNISQDVANQASISRGNKLRSETQEASLYALSVASQLLTPEQDTQKPRLALTNIVDPDISKNFELKALTTIPAGPVSFQAPARINVEATSSSAVGEQALDNLFSSKNFAAFKDQKTTAPVAVDIAGIEPFSTGYGVKRLILDASTTLNDGRLEKKGGLRAQIELPAPDASCTLNVYSNGTTVPNEGHITSLTPVEADIACSGVVLNATLMVGAPSGLKTYDVGPVTKAKSYDSIVPHMFPNPIKIDALGVVEFSGTYTLVDGTVKEIPIKKISIDAPPTGFVDIGKCLHKCNACVPEVSMGWNGCNEPYGYGGNLRPFGPDYTKYLPWPTVSGPLNGPEDSCSAPPLKSSPPSIHG